MGLALHPNQSSVLADESGLETGLPVSGASVLGEGSCHECVARKTGMCISGEGRAAQEPNALGRFACSGEPSSDWRMH